MPHSSTSGIWQTKRNIELPAFFANFVGQWLFATDHSLFITSISIHISNEQQPLQRRRPGRNIHSLAQSADADEEDNSEATEGGFGSMFVNLNDDIVRQQLRGMFQSWYLDYASYTILDRAIPNIKDGLKPVQRRILHSMKTLDDGRFNKVANIVGNTMQYHPHGDASIYGALVQLGQKELLVETQGNWGNILTGASAAAGRYIEARLSQFALDTLSTPRSPTGHLPTTAGSRNPSRFR